MPPRSSRTPVFYYNLLLRVFLTLLTGFIPIRPVHPVQRQQRAHPLSFCRDLRYDCLNFTNPDTACRYLERILVSPPSRQGGHRI